MKCQDLVKFKASKARPLPAEEHKALLAKKFRATPFTGGGIQILSVEKWFLERPVSANGAAC